METRVTLKVANTYSFTFTFVFHISNKLLRHLLHRTIQIIPSFTTLHPSQNLLRPLRRRLYPIVHQALQICRKGAIRILLSVDGKKLVEVPALGEAEEAFG
jgi:hypothetical protein